MSKQFTKGTSILLLNLMVCMVILTGCATFREPVSIAETPEQKAYALYGTYVNVQEAALRYVQSPNASPEAIRIIKAADNVAYPIANALKDATNVFREAKTAFSGDATGINTQSYLTAKVSLETAYQDAKGALNEFIDVVTQLLSGE